MYVRVRRDSKRYRLAHGHRLVASHHDKTAHHRLETGRRRPRLRRCPEEHGPEEPARAIDAMIQTGHAGYPVERTLLTTGMLDAVMNSKFQGHKKLDTPHLAIRYLARRESEFWQS